MSNLFCHLPIYVMLFLLLSCIDYVQLDDNHTNFRPQIERKHLSPHPSRLLEVISVGNNCKGQSFIVPPIEDQNPNDRLYYLWFLDDKLLMPQAIIEPSLRTSGIIALHVDRDLLQNHFSAKIPANFFDRAHLLEFFVSDKPYVIPDSRYIDGDPDNEKKHGDYAYWITTFSDDPC